MLRIAILQANSSHPGCFIEAVNGPARRLGERARIVRIWDPDLQLAKENAVLGVRATSSFEEALSDADVLMICGRFGDQHLEPALRAAAAGKPTFIDKPLANDAPTAQRIEHAFLESGTPAFSASAFRFAPEVLALQGKLDELGAFRAGHAIGISEWSAFGPRGRDVHFYGIHVLEIIATIFGWDIQSIRVEPAKYCDTAIVRWPDGREIVWQLTRHSADIYEVSFIGEHGVGRATIAEDSDYYGNLLSAIADMGETGKAPLSLGTAAHLIAVLDAVALSRSQRREVNISEILEL